MRRFLTGYVFLLLLIAQTENARSQTNDFIYQGKLNAAGSPANGSYDFEFLLYDALSGGSQIGPTISLSSISVADGIFSAKLNYPGTPFTGEDRYLEIRVRPAGQGAMTVLGPRQHVTSAPYSIRSGNAAFSTLAGSANNALSLGGVLASQYVLTNDPRLGNDRAPLPGSQFYVQNTANVQPNSNFAISGTGTANILDAATEYRLAGGRILSVSIAQENLFVGRESGITNTTGFRNTFVGQYAGQANTQGNTNSFFGTFSGQANTIGNLNAFYGVGSGGANTTGSNNSFFGASSGGHNTIGINNTFTGTFAGGSNTTGNDNSFFGTGAGFSNTTGSDNSFFGQDAGATNTATIQNSFFGSGAGKFSTASFNSFFGFNAGMNTTTVFNSFFGVSAGRANVSGGSNSYFGHAAGSANTSGTGNSFVGSQAGLVNTTGNYNTFIGIWAGIGSPTFGNTTGDRNTMIGAFASVASPDLSYATAIGADALAQSSNSITLGRTGGDDTVNIPGYVTLRSLHTAGNTPLCRNILLLISTCSSSARYKSNLRAYTPGLDLIRRLRPVSFNWKEGGMPDLGLVAEEVKEVAPLLTTTNDRGEVEGVKYDRVSVVVVNAIKEQQSQIESLRADNANLRGEAVRLRKTMTVQQEEMKALKAIVCSMRRKAAICRPSK